MENRNLSNVIVFPSSSIRSVIEAINQNYVQGAFVCDEDRELLGIVVDSDIRRAVLNNFDLNASIKTIMKTSPFFIPHEVPIEERKQLIIKSDKRLAPIVDDDRRVVDFIYLPDVLDEIHEKQRYQKNRLL